TAVVRAEVNPLQHEWISLKQCIGGLPTRTVFWFKSWQVLCLWVRSLFVFLFGTSVLFAQQHTLEVSQYLHTSWTSQEGFFKGGIHAITQTSDGYLWLASEAGGLLQFDG